MRLITILIGGRCNHVLDFDVLPKDGDALDTYVISQEGVSTQIFEFYQAEASAQQHQSYAFDDDEDEEPKNGTKKENAYSVVLQTSSSERQAFIESVSYTDNTEEKKGKKSIEVILTTAEPSEVTTVKSDKLHLVPFENQNTGASMLGLRLEHSTAEVNHFTVCFKLRDGSIPEQSRTINLSVAPDEQIKDIVLDFGSESSQMAIFDGGMDINNICRIFPQMKELLSSLDTIPSDTTGSESQQAAPPSQTPPDTIPSNKTESVTSKDNSGTTNTQNEDTYVQQILNNDELYRSIFFANTKALTGSSPVPILNESTRAETLRDLYMLTTEKDAQDLQDGNYIQMPNVKISGFGGIKEPLISGKPLSEFSDSFFYRATINRFVLNGLKEADTECVRFYVLMPNVYTHFEVCNRLRMLRNDIKGMLSNNSEQKKENNDTNEPEKSQNILRVKAVELIVVSESDASLLGALDRLTDVYSDKPLEPGLYLLIDAGKGTTDFSIVDYQEMPEEKLVSMYRSGIVGAGNAITYAHLFGLLHDYMAKIFNKEYTAIELCGFILNNIINNNDVAAVRKLMMAVDTYKIAVGKDCDKLKFGERFNAHKELYSSSINISNQSKKDTTIKDIDLNSFSGYVEACVNKGLRQYEPLSEEAQQYVDGMIRLITSEVLNKLKVTKASEFEGIKGVFFAGRAFCDMRLRKAMFNALHDIVKEEMNYLDKDHNAFDEKNICLFIHGQLLEGITSNRMYSHPYVMRRKNQDQQKEDKPKEHWVSRLGGIIIKLWEKFYTKVPVDKIHENFDYNNDDETEEYEYISSSSQINSMVYGYDLDIYNKSRDCILIGNRRYGTGGLQGRVTLFYAGDKVYLRSEQEGRCVEITPRMTGANMEKSPLAFATLFPYLKPNDSNDVYVGFADFHQKGKGHSTTTDEKDKTDSSANKSGKTQEAPNDTELEALLEASQKLNEQ